MDNVTVLGLGRMGAAFARRLAEAGWPVRAWNRSPRAVPGVEVTDGGPADAVAGARLVLLCLFDGAACRDVLEECAGTFAPGVLVVNTATVAPDEAEALQQRCLALGARYLHAPVLGSVPVAVAGSLVVLAGGAGDDVRAATDVLGVLSREVRHVGDVRAAAAAKLAVNTSLAAALLGLRDALTVAEGFGLGRDAALDVLAVGPLGATVAVKRDRLAADAEDRPADFAAEGMRKDLLLAAAAGGARLHTIAEIDRLVTTGEVPPDADIAEFARPAVVDGAPDVVTPAEA